MQCRLCGRELNNPRNPLSKDIRGKDCTGCMLSIECEVGDYETVLGILDKVKADVEAMIGGIYDIRR